MRHAGEAVDLVYNRCTDFALQDAAHAALAAACRADAVVLTPSPRHHALYADKRQLVRLSDDAFLARIGASSAARHVLAAHVPKARIVTPAYAEEIWAARKQYFFKPFAGYASRGAYRGDRITKRVWADIVDSGNYIAQAFAPPATRRAAPGEDAAALKFDLRCVSYGVDIRLLGARLYQGQTTNLRTVSGGLASVFLLKTARRVGALAEPDYRVVPADRRAHRAPGVVGPHAAVQHNGVVCGAVPPEFDSHRGTDTVAVMRHDLVAR